MDEKYKKTKVAGICGILGNIFLLIIKAFIGIYTHSQAMIADSLNSASDILASLMTFIGNKISSEPKDNTHNFGHGKAEYIFSLFISITMITVSIKLLIDSIFSLINKSHFTFSWFLIIVCIITIITKFCLYIYTKKLYIKYDNILLKSNYQDHRNDCVVTTFTLISVFLGLANIYWVDGIVGLGISIWIFISGLEIFIESYNVLMDISIDEETKTFIMNLVKEHDEIKNCYNLYSTPVGYKYFVVFKYKYLHQLEDDKFSILEDVKTARAHGELSENFEYKAAKQAKNQNESRIRYLEKMIKTAIVVSDESKDDEVGINKVVELYFEDDDEVEEFKIVTTVRGNSLKNLVSTESPIGKAVLGHKVGDRVWIAINQNAGYFVEIKSIRPTDPGDEEELRKF